MKKDLGSGLIKISFNPLYMVMIFLALTFLFNSINRDKSAEPIQITYSLFLNLAESGSLAAIQMNDAQIQIAVKEDVNTKVIYRILYPDQRGEGQGAYHARAKLRQPGR